MAADVVSDGLTMLVISEMWFSPGTKTRRLGTPRGSQSLGELLGLLGQGEVVPLAVGDEEGGQAAADVMEGRCGAKHFGVFAEDAGITCGGQADNVGDAAEGHDTADVGGGEAVGLEPGFIGGKQGDEMAAGGVAGDEDAARVAAVSSDVLDGPGESGGDVFDLGWVGFLGARR